MENKVAKKAIKTIDLLDLVNINNIKGFDIKPLLFKELLLKEKEFRASLKSIDFKEFKDNLVFIHCSSNAIIPKWAYMVLSTYFVDNNIEHLFANSKDEAINCYIEKAISNLKQEEYVNERVIVKGCNGKIKLNEQVYIKITEFLRPIAKAISYGEACSMVPVAKKTK